ncbi:hypothetical protein N7495_003306 [Penicillium taxi]|uniref:uncharacterized protein n=1 Tax=Penicillium taxi TaxID=168475 RepID=UPI002544E36C|nr:uncharacterized protein N7495_003306 [Penicillium taxi]KAJ5902778.1 hypothetical protein N7495_003306 [Penicillium taxi]
MDPFIGLTQTQAIEMSFDHPQNQAQPDSQTEPTAQPRTKRIALQKLPPALEAILPEERATYEPTAQEVLSLMFCCRRKRGQFSMVFTKCGLLRAKSEWYHLIDTKDENGDYVFPLMYRKGFDKKYQK